MPIIRLVMLGNGSELDPWRADLPSYSTLTTDEVNMTITVSCGSRVGPPQLPPFPSEYWTTENGTNILIGLPQSGIQAWWQRLATNYPNRQPPFLPGFP